MVQNYYKFVPSGATSQTQHLNSNIGIIASPYVNQIFYNNNNNNNQNHSNNTRVISAGLEHVMQWNLKSNQLDSVIHVNIDNENKYHLIDYQKYGNISCMTMSEDGTRIAIGYQTGRVIVYKRRLLSNINKQKKDSSSAVGDWSVELNSIGHSSSVSTLSFNSENTLLASGGDDSDIVLWDIIANSALYRLRGHKSRVTSLIFFSHTLVPILVSSSKDMLIKLWELDTQHCIQTLIGSRSEIWSLVKSLDETRLIAGSTGNEMRVWNMEPLLKKEYKTTMNSTTTTEDEEDNDEQLPIYQIDPVYMGTFLKQSEDRVVSMKFDASGQILTVVSDCKTVEMFRLRPVKEQEHKLALRKKDRQRKLKRRRSKQQNHFDDNTSDNEEDEEEQEDDDDELMDGGDNEEEKLTQEEEETEEALNRIKTSLQFAPFYAFNVDANVKSIDIDPSTPFQQDANGEFSNVKIKCVVSTLRNAIHEFEILSSQQQDEDEQDRTSKKKKEKVTLSHKLLTSVDKHGHNTPIRSLSISNNGKMIVSTSSKHARIWTTDSNANNANSAVQCLRVLNSSYGLSSLFVPGDKHVIIGTKKGALELFDISSGQLIMSVQAHDNGSPVWSMVMKPDKKGIITASSDMNVKFWDFELDAKTKQLTLTLEHTLKMNEDVISICVSPRGKYLAVSLLDNTVKIFYLDSLKFFLSLYGHKLPVNSIDISSDESLIVTASADKNVKIWGLDFGDCHKSIFAHEQSITQIAFVKDTHYFFTCSKDGGVKYWDADTYQLIQVVRQVRLDSPLWSMAISCTHSSGALAQYLGDEADGADDIRLLVAGHERVILSYEQNNSELLFVEEEEEKRQEEEYERDLVNSQQFVNIADPNSESTHAGKRTIETIRDGEKLIESLRVAMEHEQQHQEQQALSNVPVPMDVNPLLLGMSVNDYVWRCLTKIAPSELDLVMAILPYSYALYALQKLDYMFKYHSQMAQVEYTSRIVMILIQIHQKTILLDHKIFPLIHSLSQHMRQALLNEKNVMGFNIAALNFVKNHIRNEMEFRMWNDQVVTHVADLQKSQKVLSFREKQREQARYKKQQAEMEAKKHSKKQKAKKGRLQGMLDNLIRDDAEKEQESAPLTFEVKESAWKETQKKRKREADNERNKKLKRALSSSTTNSSAQNSDSSDNEDAEAEMREILGDL